MSLCESIETLAMAYLDDELAAEERHELEAHLTECAGCRTHCDGQRADHDVLRSALVAPAMPDLLRTRIGRALDAEDQAIQRSERRRWSQYLLPGSAMIAAAAAIAVFVTVRPAGDRVGAVAQDAVRQQSRSLPLEVQGVSTGPWLRQNFAPSMELPRFVEPGSRLIGARLLPHGVNGHDGALMSYQVELGGGSFVLSVLAVRDLRGDEMTEGDEVRVGDRTLHVIESDGRTMVTYVDGNHIGYMFMAPELSVNELISLVGRMNLVELPQ